MRDDTRLAARRAARKTHAPLPRPAPLDVMAAHAELDRARRAAEVAASALERCSAVLAADQHLRSATALATVDALSLTRRIVRLAKHLPRDQRA